MALIKSVRGFTPQIGENCYLADNATIIGDVIMDTIAVSGLMLYCVAMLMPSVSVTVLISKTEAYYILFIRNR